MNAKSLIPVATALIGFAVGWSVHRTPEPAPEATAETTAAASAPKTRSGHSGPGEQGGAAFREHHGNSGLPKAAPGEDVGMTTAVDPTPFRNALAAAASHRDQARANRLGEALGLDESQRQRLGEIMALHKADDQGAPPRTPGEMIDRLAKSAAALDAEVTQMLTPEQRAAYEALKSRRIQNQIESRAQRELATLGDRIDLSPEQREAALQANRANAAAAISKSPLGANLFGDSSSDAGPYIDMLSDAAADNPNLDLTVDPFALHREMAKLQVAQIEEKAARMATILTPAQLSQYRASLEAEAALLQSASPPAPKR